MALRPRGAKGYSSVTMRAVWVLVFVFALLGCSREDPDHCFNNLLDASCTDPEFRYCSRCEASNDGCVAEIPDKPECRAEPAVADASSSSDDGGALTSAAPTTTEDSTNATDSTTTSASPMTSSGTMGTGSSGPQGTGSSSSGGTGDPTCGDGVAQGAEQCDDQDLRGLDCTNFGLMNGMLACGTDCRYDLENCQGFDSCGNGTIDDWEECEEGDLDGMTCRDLPEFSGGTLQCDDCRFNTTDCDPCQQGGACTEDGQCCSENCSALNLCGL